MDNQIKKFIIPGSICLAILLLIGLIVYFSTPIIDEYNNSISEKENALQEKDKLEVQDKQQQAAIAQEEIKLKSIKPIYQANIDATEDANLGIFGTMFDDIINSIQTYGLYIRSIEYNMNPPEDAIYKQFAEEYNVCELKFFLVGTYVQLQTFLSHIVNDFPYLITISKADVTAFSANTDYILADLSLNLYSKKTEEDIKKGLKNNKENNNDRNNERQR